MSRLGQILLFVSLIFLIMWFVSMRALSGHLMPFVWVLLGLGIASIVGAVFKDIEFFIDLWGQRATKHGLNLGALVIIVVAIVGFVNFIAYRHVKKIDVTKEGLHSLAPETKKILGSLNSDLEVRAFFAENNPQMISERDKFKTLAELYQAQSTHVKVTYINPIKKPAEAKEYAITANGTVAIEYKGKKAQFEQADEQTFTNSIIKVTRDKNKSIYFVTGHGEKDINAQDNGSASAFKKYLEDSSYDVKPLNFFQNQKVPDDCAVLVIAGPKEPYLEPEIKAIKDYLYNGGHLFLALDPDTKTNLGSLTKDLGIVFENNFILDQLGQLVGAGGATAIGYNYSSTSDITKEFHNSMTIFHLASQLKVATDKPTGISVDEIVKSSPASFSKDSLKSGEVRFDPKKDQKGPLTIVASVSGKLPTDKDHPTPKDFSAVVSGDSDFVTNQLIDAQLNHDLALNTVAFLAKDKELVSITPKKAEGSSVAITQAQSAIVFYALVFGLPLAIFFSGGFVWFRRRTA